MVTVNISVEKVIDRENVARLITKDAVENFIADIIEFDVTQLSFHDALDILIERAVEDLNFHVENESVEGLECTDTASLLLLAYENYPAPEFV